MIVLAHALVGALAIVNARIETGDGKVIDKGTVVVDAGKIAAVGANAAVPKGADVVDAAGRTVTPGLVAAAAQVGVIEVDLEQQTVDDRMRDPIVPAFRAIEGFNPASPRIPIDRAEGVTTEVLAPNGGLIYGQAYAVDMTGAVDSAAAAKRVAMFGGFAGQARDAAGGARGAVLLKLREVFDDVRFYKANKAAYDKNQTRPLSLSRAHLEALIDVVDGKLPLVFDVNRASDIETLLRFAKEQRIKVVVNGGAEAWAVAEQLAAAQVPVMVQPSELEPFDFATIRARDDDATLLQKAGVPVILVSTNIGLGTTRTRQQAGVAVSYGLTHEEALAAVTSTPARVFGLDDIGVIAAGKRANLVLWSGDPFETSTFADLVVIDGKKMPMETRQHELAKKYRTPAPPPSPLR